MKKTNLLLATCFLVGIRANAQRNAAREEQLVKQQLVTAMQASPVNTYTDMVSVKEGNKPEQSLTAYPNPCSTSVSIVTENPENGTEYSYTITNVSGLIVSSGNIRAASPVPVTIFLPESLAGGLYMLNLLNEQQACIANTKIVVSSR